MGEPTVFSYGSHVDDRGTLVAIEFDDVPFTVRRVFTVTAGAETELPLSRGHHVTTVNELLVLSRGGCMVRLGDEGQASVHLTTPGDGVLVPRGTFIVYEFADRQSAIVVLADRPYADPGA